MSAARVAKILLGAFAVVAAIAAGAAVLLATLDLRAIVERRMAGVLARHVTIGALEIRWGSPVVVVLKGLRVANAAWGTHRDHHGHADGGVVYWAGATIVTTL